MKILGVSALYHDSAAALVEDGKIVAAAQEERFSRIKNDAEIPFEAIKFCIEEGKKNSDAPLDYIAFYDLPLLRLDRYLKNILAVGDEANNLVNSNLEKFLSRRLWIHQIIMKFMKNYMSEEKFEFFAVKHHLAHAASAFFPSPFSKSVILTVDGVGEWTTLSLGLGNNNHLECKKEIRYPHSLGLFYSALSQFCGFKVNFGEYKFMGLAPYGKPRFTDIFEKDVIDIKEDGSFQLNLDFFNFQKGLSMINEDNFSQIVGASKRLPETNISKVYMDIAASAQKITEKIILRIVRYAKGIYGSDTDSLVMAGGVALNCVSNGKILQENIFKNIWIQPAAGDAGAALGAALYLYYDVLNNERFTDNCHDFQRGSFLGPVYSDSDIEEFLKSNSYVFHREENIFDIAADLLNKQQVIGLFQNCMEFGPRALGSRSIIADARSNEMQTRLNLKIKFRESFRPFAPATLKERVQDYFEVSKNFESPYMMFCLPIRKNRCIPFNIDIFFNENELDVLSVIKTKRSDIPAVTHVDYSARLQTVDRATNPFFYNVIKSFEDLTGCSTVVNTSFNLRGEPIVCTPKDACECFMKSDMDALIIGNFILFKADQTKKANSLQIPKSRHFYSKIFDLEIEKQKILEWAHENFSSDNFLTKRKYEAKSFFIPFDNSGNIMKYEFQTLPELQNLLLKLWENEPIMKKIVLIVSVAAFKSKPSTKVYSTEEKSVRLDVPDYIYEF